LIRGAIAFGLVLRLSNIITNPVKLGIIETTALTLVVSTTLIFGSTMSLVQKGLLSKLSDDEIIEQLLDESDLIEDQADNLQQELESKHTLDDEEQDSKKKKEKKGKNKTPTGKINKTVEKTKEKKSKTPDMKSRGSVNEDSSEEDEFEEFLHPNMRLSKVNE
jgi:hypothetical protein